jgi:hypothetical protein
MGHFDRNGRVETERAERNLPCSYIIHIGLRAKSVRHPHSCIRHRVCCVTALYGQILIVLSSIYTQQSNCGDNGKLRWTASYAIDLLGEILFWFPPLVVAISNGSVCGGGHDWANESSQNQGPSNCTRQKENRKTRINLCIMSLSVDHQQGEAKEFTLNGNKFSWFSFRTTDWHIYK